MWLLPWLMLVASLTFTFSGPISARLNGNDHRRARRERREMSGTIRVRTGLRGDRRFPWWGWVLQLAIATYGGYFGGGMGIMMLAVLAIAGMSDIHEMNGLKAMLGVIINGVALAEFIVFDAAQWTPGLALAAGATAGGYIGASVARRTDTRYVRWSVVLIAWSLTMYFFLR
jgi:uncharacterized membrane protein YfcA